MEAVHWIEKLGLLPHPEGGFYKEVYRSKDSIESEGLPERFAEKRDISTAIYYLLQAGDFSAFHRIKSDEIWHHYEGGLLEIVVIAPSGEFEKYLLGKEGNALPMLIVPHNCWFAARPYGSCKYVLAGCTVAPGFDFLDFEMAEFQQLADKFPNQIELIKTLTRS